MKSICIKLSVFAVFMSICSFVYAQRNQVETISTTQNTTVLHSQNPEINRKAQEWNLQPEEWQRYQELMEGPLGIYSPNLDPLTALGISARSDEERRRYAEMQVQAETKRVERELAYQRAYDDAFKRMYPSLMPVVFGASSQAMMDVFPTGSNRIAVFVSDNCTACDTKVQQLQNAGLSFDIYMVNSNNDDTLIRRWATKTGIDPQKVFARFITLNHDAGRWQALGAGGDLPAVVKEVDGKWQRQ